MPKTPRSANTCSSYSHRRGSDQRVVAFSYYEHDIKMSKKRMRTGDIKDSHYIEGILINIERLQTYYPGNFLVIKTDAFDIKKLRINYETIKKKFQK